MTLTRRPVDFAGQPTISWNLFVSAFLGCQPGWLRRIPWKRPRKSRSGALAEQPVEQLVLHQSWLHHWVPMRTWIWPYKCLQQLLIRAYCVFGSLGLCEPRGGGWAQGFRTWGEGTCVCNLLRFAGPRRCVCVCVCVCVINALSCLNENKWKKTWKKNKKWTYRTKNA